ncbi:MAG: TVP38/TMEM64 family protein [Opitutae bacterium]|nr:TVP38/TMEM64 family protein [Opitutae bacterium]
MNRPLYRRKRAWGALALLGAAMLVLAWRAELAAFFHEFGWEELRTGVIASGPWAPLMCILLYAFFTVFFLPTSLIGILVALLYGPWLGLPICLAGLGLGMGVAFLLSRYLLHEWIERRIGDTKLYRHIEEHMRRDGGKLVLFTRILPINPFAFLNYAYGLTRISFGRYLLASVAGVIPNTLALLWTTHAAGQMAAGQMDGRIFILLFAGAALFAVLAWLPRLLRRKMPGSLAAPGDEIASDD